MNRNGTFRICLAILFCLLLQQGQLLRQPVRADDRPHPANNPGSSLMLEGDWVPENVHQIDFARLVRVPSQHVTVSDVRKANGMNLHNYEDLDRLRHAPPEGE